MATRSLSAERTLEQLLERVIRIEEKLEKLSKRMEDVENRHVAQELQSDDKIKEVAIKWENKIVSSELRCEGKIDEIGSKLQVVGDKATAIEIRLGEMNKEWPTLQEANAIRAAGNNRSKVLNRELKISFAEKYKNKAKDTMVLIGDSLTRGVGEKLERQSHMVTTMCRGGAKIENIAEEIGLMKDNEDRHVVVIVGTNNVQSETDETIVSKYKGLLEASKKVKHRKVSVVGIPRRYDLTGYQNSRRIGANARLKKMCFEQNIEFIECEPYRSRIAKDGLHLNFIGQNELAKTIFDHCKTFLV